MAIRAIDVARSVRHTFQVSKLRVALTLLGIMIGAGAMVLLAGLLVAGKEALLRLAQGANETDIIKVHEADAPKKDAKKTTRPLSTFDGDALHDSALLDGAGVNAVASKQTKAKYASADGPKEKATTLFAGERNSLSLYRVSLEQGRYFNDDDFAHGRRVCVVGQEMWTELLGKKPIGAADGNGEVHITVDGVVLQVVGVLAHKPTMSHGNGTWMWNRRILVPSSTYEIAFEKGHNVRAIFVRLHDAVEADATVAGKARQLTDVVERTLLRRHEGVKNFEIESDARGEDQEELILKIIEVLLFGTGVIALFVGGINIMNIMLVTVTERTKEIGIRRAVGAAPSEIARQFVLEAAVLAAAGGILGVVGGIAMTGALSVILTHVLAPWRFVVEPWAIALALGMATSTGIAFGLFPALRAARLDPVAALRSE
jgi:putative ABC transport system permease protein